MAKRRKKQAKKLPVKKIKRGRSVSKKTTPKKKTSLTKKRKVKRVQFKATRKRNQKRMPKKPASKKRVVKRNAKSVKVPPRRRAISKVLPKRVVRKSRKTTKQAKKNPVKKHRRKLPTKKRSRRLPTAKRFGHQKNQSKNKRPIPVDLEFLDNNFVPRNFYEAYKLPWSFHQFSGNNLAPIEAGHLKRLCNDFRAKHKRGIDFGRLMINFMWKLDGKVRHRTVGTARIYLDSDDTWQDLLAKYSGLVITLYDYDQDKYDDEDRDPKIYIEFVILELLHIEDEGTIDV